MSVTSHYKLGNIVYRTYVTLELLLQILVGLEKSQN